MRSAPQDWLGKNKVFCLSCPIRAIIFAGEPNIIDLHQRDEFFYDFCARYVTMTLQTQVMKELPDLELIVICC
jgi:hypothetical protein